MKNFLVLVSVLLLLTACKKDPDDPVLPDPTPTLYTFDGIISDYANSTLVTQDNNLLISGNLEDFYSLLKVSKSGDLIWRKDFDNYDGASRVSGIAIADNKDIFICGYTKGMQPIFERDVLLIKTNSNGDTLWTRTYGDADDNLGFNIIATADGNLLISGVTHSVLTSGESDIYVLKVTTNGDTLWTRRFSDPEMEFPLHVIQTQDGAYLLTGHAKNMAGPRQLYFVKVSADGIPLWKKKISSLSANTGYASAELPNGDVITCGITTLADTTQVLLVKTDQQGNVIWDKVCSEGYRFARGNAIAIDNDGAFIITGGTHNPYSGQRNIIIIKTDQHGDVNILKEFGEDGVDYGQNVILDDNGDYLFTGAYDRRIFLTRTDSHCVFK